MTWDYRLVRKQIKATPGAEHDDSYAVHEVYYSDAGEPVMVTEDAVGVGGETEGDALEAYAQMAAAFTEPVLEYGLFTRTKGKEVHAGGIR